MRKQIPAREFALKVLIVVLAAGTVGFALKFTSYIEAKSLETVSGTVTQTWYSDGYTTVILSDDQKIALKGNLLDNIQFETQTIIQRGEGYYLPIWPNIGDAAFLIATAVALAILGLRRPHP